MVVISINRVCSEQKGTIEDFSSMVYVFPGLGDVSHELRRYDVVMSVSVTGLASVCEDVDNIRQRLPHVQGMTGGEIMLSAFICGYLGEVAHILIIGSDRRQS